MLLSFWSNAHAGTVHGTGYKWYPLHIDFQGPVADERGMSPNPFLDYRLDVTLTAPDGRQIIVPGFFDGDGNGGSSGNVWRVRFAPDEVGTWQYHATLRTGSQVAVAPDTGAGTAVELSDASGRFAVSSQPTDAPGFFQFGRLEYIGDHYLKFRDGPFWIKGGTDSPENFLGYAGIEGTVDQGGIDGAFLHDFETHTGDFRPGDPEFTNPATGVNSHGIIGALNYLADQGVNSIYLLPMNLGGDGQETYPFVGADNSRFDKTHYDIGKLHQWNQVFLHAQQRGIALNIVLSETERANERWLDEGQLGVERKLFFRELVARFAWMPAAKWNLGEENDYPVSELRKQAAWLAALDWSEKPIAVHTQINNFRDYEELVGDPLFSATSIQYDPPYAGDFVEQWRSRSESAGHPWVLDMDENTGGITASNAPTRRKQILYDVLFSGGSIEWYFGYHPLPLGGDVTAGNFRLREPVWEMTRIARTFMEQHLPFWRMSPADSLLRGERDNFGGGEVLAALGEIYAIYLPAAGSAPELDLRGIDGRFEQRWFNPVSGQFQGSTRVLDGGSWQALGTAPARVNDDWVVLIKKIGSEITLDPPDTDTDTDTDADAEQPAEQPADESEQPSVAEPDEAQDSEQPASSDDADIQDQAEPEPASANQLPVWQYDSIAAAVRGQSYRLQLTAVDEDGVAPVVAAETLPPGMQIDVGENGLVTLNWNVPVDAPDHVNFTLSAVDVADSAVRVDLPITLEVIDGAVSSGAVSSDGDTETGEDTGADSVDSTSDLPVSTEENLPPRIYGLRNRSVMVGERLNLVATPVDPEGIVPNLRTNQLPEGASFDDNGDGSRTLRWVPQPQQLGTHQLDVTAEDVVTGSETSQSVTLEVIDQTVDTAPLFQEAGEIVENHAPVFAAFDIDTAGLTLIVGQTLDFTVRAIDPDGPVPALNVLSPPAGASFEDNLDGSRQFRWRPSGEQSGDHTLVFVATDAADTALRGRFEVTVSVQAQ